MPRGYDALAANYGLLLDVRMREGVGALTHDWARPHHEDIALVNTPTWTVRAASGVEYLAFAAATHEYLNLPAADSGDLDFTAGNFSGVAWVNTNATGNRYVFCKAVAGWATGWAFYIPATAGPPLALVTFQAGPTSQYTYSSSIGTNAWRMVGFSRDGASVRIYVDGEDATVTPATHIDPDSAAAADFVMGATQAGAAGWWSGSMWGHRVWNRALSASEFKALFEFERDLWAV